MKPVLIYFLKDPTNPKKGYVGQTIHWKTRFSRHISGAKSGEKTYRCNWIRSLAAKGLKPEFEHLAQVPETGWKRHEIDYIAAFKSLGFDLVNTTLGGDGGPALFGKDNHNFGKPLRKETRAKISVAKLGSKQSAETVAKRTATLTGKKRTPETRAKMSAAQKALDLVGEKHHAFGKTYSAEARANMSTCKQGEKNPSFGRKQSLETVAKRLATRKLNAILRSKKKD